MNPESWNEFIEETMEDYKNGYFHKSELPYGLESWSGGNKLPVLEHVLFSMRSTLSTFLVLNEEDKSIKYVIYFFDSDPQSEYYDYLHVVLLPDGTELERKKEERFFNWEYLDNVMCEETEKNL